MISVTHTHAPHSHTHTHHNTPHHTGDMSFTDKDKTDKGIFARTATYTAKRARRAQTKLKQSVGQGDETKDEVFDEFLLNFNKQQSVAGRLHTELKNYLRCVNQMQVMIIS